MDNNKYHLGKRESPLFKELTLINKKLHSFFASEQFCLIYNKRFAHFGAICVIFSAACSMLLRLFCVCR